MLHLIKLFLKSLGKFKYVYDICPQSWESVVKITVYMLYKYTTMQYVVYLLNINIFILKALTEGKMRTDNERQPALCQGHHSKVTSAHELLESIFLILEKLSL